MQKKHTFIGKTIFLIITMMTYHALFKLRNFLRGLKPKFFSKLTPTPNTNKSKNLHLYIHITQIF